MRIQEAAETLGLTTETLRYYERVGLIGQRRAAVRAVKGNIPMR